MKWSYGITTVPSRLNTLFPRTLASLERAGFVSPRIFIDGQATLAEKLYDSLQSTTRQGCLRTAGSWVLSAYELYLRQPLADRYAIFQDDFVTYRNLRQYLETCGYPDRSYLNLYTFPMNQALANGRTGWYPSNQLGKGAVALIFDREAITTLLSQRYLVERAQDPKKGWQSIDGGISVSMKNASFKEYVHNPSLVQHTGDVSSMGHGKYDLAPSFRGEDFDAMELCK